MAGCWLGAREVRTTADRYSTSHSSPVAGRQMRSGRLVVGGPMGLRAAARARARSIHRRLDSRMTGISRWSKRRGTTTISWPSHDMTKRTWRARWLTLTLKAGARGAASASAPSLIAARQRTSLAARTISGTAASAFETGQDALAWAASAWNSPSSTPGTVASQSSSILVMVGPAPDGRPQWCGSSRA